MLTNFYFYDLNNCAFSEDKLLILQSISSSSTAVVSFPCTKVKKLSLKKY